MQHCNDEVDIEDIPPDMVIEENIGMLRNNRALTTDESPAELFKAGSQEMVKESQALVA